MRSHALGASTPPWNGPSTGTRSAARWRSYQEIKHRFADMKLWLEASYAITAQAADAVDRDLAEPVGAGRARPSSTSGRYGPELMQDCVQMHGGIGVTFDHDLHLFLRRVVTNAALFGTPEPARRPADRACSTARAGRLVSDTDDVESVEDFAARARSWLAAAHASCRRRRRRLQGGPAPTRRGTRPPGALSAAPAACSSTAASPGSASRAPTEARD